MSISDIPIFSMLRTRMQWHQERQRVLAENVANADTPNYRARDLSELKFELPPPGGLNLARTNAGHLGGSSGGLFRAEPRGHQIRPSGNAVGLEDEMLKVASNQMDYQAATSLYSRSLGLVKTALGKR